MFDEIGVFYRGLVLGLMIAAPVGPIGLLCIRRAIHRGFAISFATGVGAAGADTIFGAFASFSVAAILDFIRHYDHPIRLLGGGFLLLVAWHTWRDPPRQPPQNKVSATGALTALLSGFVITMTNPVTMFAILAVVATFGGLHNDRDALTIIAGIFCGSTLWWFILSGSVSLIRGHFTENRVMVINRATAVALAVLALWAVVSGIAGFLGYALLFRSCMNLRNVAIIAHVDHGKTTLVDAMLRQSGTFRANQQVAERAMDSNDLERERGITILAKCTSILHGDLRINIVDTPGHADFGGEVERILSMVDGAVLLVDAAEGPLPQTKFVVSKALAIGLSPMVIINKIDRPDARAHQVHDEVFDLFAALDATEEQLDFPTLFASGRQGWAIEKMGDAPKDLEPLFRLIATHVPSPVVDAEAPFAMLASILEANPYLGRLLTGRIRSGTVRPNMAIKAMDGEGRFVEQRRITKVLAFRGLERVGVEEAQAGDIVALAGLGKATVADTICDPAVTEPIKAQPVDPPTIAMTFSVNDSPLAGTEGDKVTSRVIRERLMREAEGNVAICFSESSEKDAFEVSGRGELQLGILIETMRREGFELSISRPRVLFTTENGERLEPIEEVLVDVDEPYSGIVVSKMSERKAELTNMRPSGGGKIRLVFLAPSRGLIGYYGEFLSDTRGTGIMNRLFHGYAPYKGAIAARRTGVMVSNGKGEAVAYAMWKLEDRGPMLITPGTKVYEGMIIGEHSKSNDLDVNVLEGKKLTNIRAAGKDEAVRLTPPLQMTLEKAIAYIADDELVEVTPKSVRLRKRHLDPNVRKRAARQADD